MNETNILASFKLEPKWNVFRIAFLVKYFWSLMKTEICLVKAKYFLSTCVTAGDPSEVAAT